MAASFLTLTTVITFLVSADAMNVIIQTNTIKPKATIIPIILFLALELFFAFTPIAILLNPPEPYTINYLFTLLY